LQEINDATVKMHCFLQGGPKVLSQEFCPPAILNSRGKGMVLQCKV